MFFEDVEITVDVPDRVPVIEYRGPTQRHPGSLHELSEAL
jgi:hypothetical protein